MRSAAARRSSRRPICTRKNCSRTIAVFSRRSAMRSRIAKTLSALLDDPALRARDRTARISLRPPDDVAARRAARTARSSRACIPDGRFGRRDAPRSARIAAMRTPPSLDHSGRADRRRRHRCSMRRFDVPNRRRAIARTTSRARSWSRSSQRRTNVRPKRSALALGHDVSRLPARRAVARRALPQLHELRAPWLDDVGTRR